MIYELLPIGRHNKVKSSELLARTGLKNERALCSAVRRERLEGKLILSCKAGGGGYWKPETPDEVSAFVASFEREAKAIFAMLKTARAEAKQIEGQQALDI